MGIIQVSAQEFRSRETLPTQTAVVALLRREMLKRCVVYARMKIVHMARQVIFFRERFVAQLTHWTLLAIDDDV